MSRPLPAELRDAFARTLSEVRPAEVTRELDNWTRRGALISHPGFTYHPDNCPGGCRGTGEVFTYRDRFHPCPAKPEHYVWTVEP